MKVAVLELPARWGEPGAALDDVAARLAAGPPADLVLLPESSLCGYVSPTRDFDQARFAEPLDGPTAQRCGALAREHDTTLVAPLVVRADRADPDVYNAMVGYAPGGVTFVYRKRHPWVPETWATPGPHAPPVVTIAGVRVTIAICYDLHFAADDMSAELAAAELLLFASAWVERPDTRPARLAELARRFDVAIANANWAPGVVRVPGQGGSCAIARGGTVIARAPLAGRVDFEVRGSHD
jgi:predicted amidohydrolase